MIEIIEDYEPFLKRLRERAGSDNEAHAKTVREIVQNVALHGDAALFSYTKQFDHWDIHPGNLKFTRDELREAYETLDPHLKEILLLAKERICRFQRRELQNSWFMTEPGGGFLGTRVQPLERVGLYAPGGRAAYPSSVLMNALPAVVAGVKEILLATPLPEGKPNGTVLGAAYAAGVSEVYKIGGAQAIAAMAYGTESVPKVDKIVGPGNIYVALAKKEVFGLAGIDSIAGPSEILIIADHSARPNFVAADLLSQAEHDPLASGILITDSKELAESARKEIERLFSLLSRKEILRSSLQKYCGILLVKDIEEAVEIANRIAPEHLELAVADPFSLLPHIRNAGAIFLGHYTPEALGDYLAGSNHVLPTNGTARFFSPLSAQDFLKRTSVISFPEAAFRSLAEKVEAFAEEEGLDGHARSVRERLL
ncbi:MAG: histidinol dehydrogenase [Fusobacteriaceae bacterium]|jgi:histidinol dehydrogenase|nr:histidinol dehydrogenase [Fusobacteriaceae bacterium]